MTPNRATPNRATPIDPQVSPRILTESECFALADQVLGMVSDCQAQVQVVSEASADTHFARGDAHIARQSENVGLTLSMTTPAGKNSDAATNRVDAEGLAAMVAEARALAAEQRQSSPGDFIAPYVYPKSPAIFFDATAAAMAADPQADAFHRAVDATRTANLVSAGDLSIALTARALVGSDRVRVYERQTYGDWSLTARTKEGTGSGWAWSGHEDWGRVSIAEPIERAIDLGRRSANPVAIEPGRYTVILEPAALGGLLQAVIGAFKAQAADMGMSIFSGPKIGTNKIGQQVLDRRLSLRSDPWDADIPASTIRYPSWRPITAPSHWIRDGILTTLEYDEAYGKRMDRPSIRSPYTIRLDAKISPQTLEEMIASTARGIWVNRFSHVTVMNAKTMLSTGTTRDGTFLIEHGKITKALKNFRFTESPFFILNRLEAAGPSVRALRSVVAPRVKVRDFDFTSLTDAI